MDIEIEGAVQIFNMLISRRLLRKIKKKEKFLTVKILAGKKTKVWCFKFISRKNAW